MSRIKIDGLSAITPPPGSLPPAPGSLTQADLDGMEEVRFVKEILDPADFAAALLAIQGMCQWAANTGQNPDLIGIEDFDIAVITTRNDGENVGFVDSGAALVARSKKTKRYGIFDLEPPKGFSLPNYARTTALDLIELSRPEQPPVEHE